MSRLSTDPDAAATDDLSAHVVSRRALSVAIHTTTLLALRMANSSIKCVVKSLNAPAADCPRKEVVVTFT